MITSCESRVWALHPSTAHAAYAGCWRQVAQELCETAVCPEFHGTCRNRPAAAWTAAAAGHIDSKHASATPAYVVMLYCSLTNALGASASVNACVQSTSVPDTLTGAVNFRGAVNCMCSHYPILVPLGSYYPWIPFYHSR